MGVGGSVASSTPPSLSIQVGSHDQAHSDQLSDRTGSAELEDVASAEYITLLTFDALWNILKRKLLNFLASLWISCEWIASMKQIERDGMNMIIPSSDKGISNYTRRH